MRRTALSRSTWRRAFDSFADARDQAGVQQHRVLRPVDDPRYVTVDLDFAMAFAVLSLIRAAIRAELIESPEWLPVTALSFATPLALIVSIVVWMNLTKGVVEGHGGRVTVLRNWALSWGSLILFLSYLLPAKTPTAFHVARAGAATLLVAGLLISRTKLHRWLAEPAPAADMASHTHLPQERVPQRLRSGPPPGTPIARLLPPAVEVPSRDWDASSWDPEIQADIERRRRRGEPPR